MAVACLPPTKLDLLESALRSCFSVIATHILAGQVDTILPGEEVEAAAAASSEAAVDQQTLTSVQEERPGRLLLLSRLWWFCRYFNPVNLAWRYYSILAYRCMRGRLSRRQIAFLNFEPHPLAAPMPYLQAEAMADHEYRVRRLEIAGVFSAQGLLSLIAAYQGLLAVQFTLSSSGFGFLPNVSKAMAVLGLFRVLVAPWIANKVYVEVQFSAMDQGIGFTKQAASDSASPSWGRLNRAMAAAWVMVLMSLVALSLRSYIRVPAASFSVPSHLIDRTIEALYNYVSVSALAFHGFCVWSYGPMALGNRHPLFNHWLYHLQTFFFLVFLACTLLIGLVDFIRHDFYQHCFF